MVRVIVFLSLFSLLRRRRGQRHRRADRLSRFPRQLQQQPDLQLAAGGPPGPKTPRPLRESGASRGRRPVRRASKGNVASLLTYPPVDPVQGENFIFRE